MTRLKRFWAALKAAGNLSIPVYVTRKNASGEIGTFSMSGIAAVVLLLLLTLNVLLWGIAGIIVAIGVIL